MTPIDYIEMFWKDDLNELISEQTNLYSVQQSGKSISTAPKEIEQLIGVQMQMSIIKLPRYDMYWASETKIENIFTSGITPKRTSRKIKTINCSKFHQFWTMYVKIACKLNRSKITP